MTLPAPLAHVLADGLAPVIARWSTRREREITAAGSPLPGSLQAFAADLGIEDPTRVRLQLATQVPLPVPALCIRLARRIGLPVFHPAGMALGLGICALRADDSLLRHELVHVAQYQRLGGHLPFMRQYLFECLHDGYADSPLETEARDRSLRGGSTGSGNFL